DADERRRPIGTVGQEILQDGIALDITSVGLGHAGPGQLATVPFLDGALVPRGDVEGRFDLHGRASIRMRESYIPVCRTRQPHRVRIWSSTRLTPARGSSPRRTGRTSR